MLLCECSCTLGIAAYTVFFFLKQKTAYDMRISDWSSDVCSSDLQVADAGVVAARATFKKSSADYRRSEALIEEGAVSRQLYESAEAEQVHAASTVTQNNSQAVFARKQQLVLAAQTR